MTPDPENVEDNYGWLLDALRGNPEDQELGVPFFMSMNDFYAFKEQNNMDLTPAVRRMT